MTPPDIAKLRAALAKTQSIELPDDLREPLHSLQADLDYLIARIVAGTHRDGRRDFANMARDSIRERLSQIESAAYRLAALALLPPSAEVESGRDEPGYAAGFASCWAAFDEHLNRELAARVPHVVDTVMRMVSARSTPYPASQPAEAEVE